MAGLATGPHRSQALGRHLHHPLPPSSRLRAPMESDNLTLVSEFILLGLSGDPMQQTLLFWLFLPMYVVTVVGNLLIILAILTDTHLHTPMYFFLANLSLVDVLFSSTTVPKMLVDLHTRNRAIPFVGCLAQMYTFHWLGPLDTFLLAVMAIDRFMAFV